MQIRKRWTSYPSLNSLQEASNEDDAEKTEFVPEEVELDSVRQSKMSQIDQMRKDGKSAEEIAKAMKMKVKDIKKIMGE